MSRVPLRPRSTDIRKIVTTTTSLNRLRIWTPTSRAWQTHRTVRSSRTPLWWGSTRGKCVLLSFPTIRPSWCTRPLSSRCKTQSKALGTCPISRSSMTRDQFTQLTVTTRHSTRPSAMRHGTWSTLRTPASHTLWGPIKSSRWETCPASDHQTHLY